MNVIAERLKQLREVRNLSQRAFALQLGIPQPSYSRYETSDDERFVYPGSNIVIRICKMFDCRAGWLLGIEGDESSPSALSAPPRETKTEITTGDGSPVINGGVNGSGNIVGNSINVTPPPVNITISITVNINGQEKEGEEMSNIQNATWIKACPACGHGVSKRAKACPTCGHDMQPMPPAGNPKLLKPCPACGHTVSKRAFRCPGCGHRLVSDLRMIWIVFVWIIIVGAIITILSAGAR